MVENLSGITDIVPENVAQVRPLVSLPPEEQMEVWAEVVKTAPPSGVTAQHVKATVRRAKGQTTTPRTPPPNRFDVEAAEKHIRELFMDWLRHCDDEDAMIRMDNFLNTLTMLSNGRAKFVMSHTTDVYHSPEEA